MKTEPLNERIASLTGAEAQRVSGCTAETLVPNCALILQTFGSSLVCHTAVQQTTKTSADAQMCKSTSGVGNCTSGGFFFFQSADSPNKPY